MTELMNLEMGLPAPLNPPFRERAKMSAFGRVQFTGIGGADLTAPSRLLLSLCVLRVLVWLFLSRLRTLWMLIPW